MLILMTCHSNMIQLVIILTINTALSYFYKDLRLASYMTNIISHCMLSIFAMTVYLTSSLDNTDIRGVGNLEVFCGEWLFWYLAYDMLKMVLKVTLDNNVIYYVHHVAAMTLLTIMIKGPFLHHYIPVICMFEMSSVPLNVRYALRYVGVDSLSKEILYTEMVFFVTFFFFRWVVGFKKAFEAIVMINSMEHESGWTVATIVATNVLVLAFFLMHVVWTAGIFKKVVKYVKRFRSRNKLLGKNT